MRKYDSYKDSDVEWIGEIPTEWKKSKFKYVSELQTGNSLNDEQKILYESENPDNIPYISSKDIDVEFKTVNYDNGLRIPKENNRFRVSPKGSFLMVIEGGSSGRKMVFLDREVCYVNKLCSFYSNENTKFQYYFVQSFNYQDKFKLSLSGLIGGVSISNLREFEIPLPPLSEQKQIVSYLDRKTEGIDKLIQTKIRKIELLKEYRTSLISKVVTKGLNPNVEMKDSGVEWIGEIPSHWNTIKTYLITENLDGKRVPLNSVERCDIQGEIPYWGSGGIVDYINKYIFDEELLLVGEDGSPFFDSYRDVSFYVNEKIWVNNHIHILRSKKDIVDTKFLVNSFNTVDYKEYISGSTRDKLTQSDLNRIIHPIPPLSEQTQIVSYLDEQTQLIDKNIQTEERKIELLKEFRQSLISEVVTGKIKVYNDEKVH